MKLLADATLPNLNQLFVAPFKLTLYNTPSELQNYLPTHDILLCRSTLKVTAALLADSNIKCVATASSGIDHIDSAYLKEQGITLLDAKGCNAVAVADYVLTVLAFLYQQDLLIGNKAGIIGVGEVGSRVKAQLQAIGLDVVCYDPIREKLDKHDSYCSFAELATCDLLCIHANLHHSSFHPSANLLTADFFAQLQPGTTIINAARGGIIDETALLKTGKKMTYCTDVYQNEPAINASIVDFSTLCTPHIAGHSIEAKTGAILKICQQLCNHYGLTVPISLSATPSRTPTLLPKSEMCNFNWQKYALSLYNPLVDTLMLKIAKDKSHAFLTQRHAHQHRHDFALYEFLMFR